MKADDWGDVGRIRMKSRHMRSIGWRSFNEGEGIS